MDTSCIHSYKRPDTCLAEPNFSLGCWNTSLWFEKSFCIPTLDYISIVTHAEIYPYPDQLPTFSSPSIETHLHRIEGLSERFLYFNDDISLLAPICPEDYFDKNQEYIYFNPAYPSGQFIYELGCPENCTDLGNNGICDPECNLLACLYDNDECDQIDNPDEPFTGEAFYKSIDYTNLLFNHKFHVDERKRRWLSHMPFMIRRTIVNELQEIFTTDRVLKLFDMQNFRMLLKLYS